MHAPPSANHLQAIWQGKWIIIVMIGLSLYWGYSQYKKTVPRYISSSRIYVERHGPRIINAETGVMAGASSFLTTQSELIRSSPVLELAVASADLKSLKTFAGLNEPVPALRQSLRASVSAHQGFIDVSFSSIYPAESASIINAVVQAYIEFCANTKRSSSAEILELLQKERAKRDPELREKLQALTEFRLANDILSYDTENGNVILTRFEGLVSKLNQVEVLALEAKSFYETAKTMADAPERLRLFVKSQGQFGTDYLVETRDTNNLIKRLERLENLRYQMQVARMATSHPDMKHLNSEIADLIFELDQSRQSSSYARAQLDSLAAHCQVLTERQGMLEQAVREQQNEVVSINKMLAEYEFVNAAYEQVLKTCDILDTRMRELKLIEDPGALNIHVLEVARPSLSPVGLSKRQVMQKPLSYGLLVGAGLAWLRNMLDRRVRSEKEISAITGAPILGAVPSMLGCNSLASRACKTDVDPHSQEAEAFRVIRTHLFISSLKDEPKVIQVTSSDAKDGKSTVISNLGITIANSGKKVLILDADLRHPKQQKYFKISQLQNLSTVLAGRDSLDATIVHTNIDGLDVLPAGSSNAPNPAEILGSKAFCTLLTELRTSYDCILVDSTAIMPVADARVLASLCDGTLLVVRPKKATRKSIQLSKDNIHLVDARLLGIILNDVSNKRNRYGYYYYHGSACSSGRYYRFRRPRKIQDLQLSKAMEEIPFKEYSRKPSSNNTAINEEIPIKEYSRKRSRNNSSTSELNAAKKISS